MQSDKKLTIHFSLNYYNFDDQMGVVKKGVFKATRVVNQSDSLRNTAISVIKEGFDKGINHWTKEVSSDTPIGIHLKSEKKSEEWDGWGIQFALDKKGRIIFLNGYDPLTHDWTFSEIMELADAGYIDGDPTNLTIDLPSELGGGPGDVFEWLGFIGNIFGILGFFGISISLPGMLKKLKLKLNDKKYRQIIKQWEDENRIMNPSQIREFFDLKNQWRLNEVKKRLGIGDGIAIELLTALGYKPKGDNWVLCSDAKSTRRREKWLKSENEFFKSSDM